MLLYFSSCFLRFNCRNLYTAFVIIQAYNFLLGFYSFDNFRFSAVICRAAQYELAKLGFVREELTRQREKERERESAVE